MTSTNSTNSSEEKDANETVGSESSNQTDTSAKVEDAASDEEKPKDEL